MQTAQRIHRRSCAPFRQSGSAPRLVMRAATTATKSSVEQVAAWAKAKGIAMDKVQVSDDLATGQPLLIAAKDIGAGEAVVTVPEGNWLSSEAVKKSAIGPAVAGLEPWLQIALLLVHERFVKPSQEWGPYVSALPATPPSPLFWTAEQQAMLKGTQLMDSLMGYRAFFQQKHQELFGPQGLLAHQAALFPASTFTLHNFTWGVATVRARAHAPLEGAALSLVPLADELCHRRAANTAWRVKSGGFLSRGQQLTVEATRAIRKGEALSLDYAPGKLDNGVLLDFGVVDRSSPKPGYSLTLSLPQNDRNMDDKLDIAEMAGLGPAAVFQLTPGSVPSNEMLGYLRLMQLAGPDAFLLEAVFRKDVWGFMCEPVSQDNEKALCDTMVVGAREVLSSYPNTIDADLALLRSGSLAPGSPEEAAVLVRLGEAESLDTACQWFEERLGGLKRLAYYQERRLRRLGLIDDEGRTTYDSFFKDGIA